MQLIYRGISSSLAPSSTSQHQDTRLSYRGVRYPSISSDSKLNNQTSNQILIYRGATYNRPLYVHC